MFDLTGRTALITGAGQGVGKEIAETFARQGARVVINDVDADRAEEVVQDIEADGGTARAAVADVTDPAAVAQAVTRIAADWGTIDVLVNNAGNGGARASEIEGGAFWEIDAANWRPYIDVNLYGPMNCARAVLPGMVEQGYGRCITIISDAGRVGEAGLEAYSAGKAGAAGFTRALARAAGRHGVTANNIAIAATITPTTASVFQDAELAKRMLARYVVRRPGEPSDIAPVVLLLASAESAWITGQTYPVNGGFSLAL